MSKPFLADWLKVRRLEPAQRLMALRRLEPSFETDERLTVSKPVWQAALDLNKRAAEDQRTFRNDNLERAMHKERARTLDADLDRLVALVHHLLDGARRALSADNPERAEADDLYAAMFPNGLAAIVQRRYVHQHQLVLGMLQAARDGRGRWLRAVGTLGLMTFLTEIERVNTQYGEALTDASVVRTYDDVRALDTEAYQAYALVVLTVLAAYPTDEEADQERRNAILTPVRAQEDEARLYRRRRRGEARPGQDAEEAEGAEDAASEAVSSEAPQATDEAETPDDNAV